jgi:hypothetical protein
MEFAGPAHLCGWPGFVICHMVWLMHQNIKHTQLGWTEGRVAQWLEHLVYIRWIREGLGSNPRVVTLLIHPILILINFKWHMTRMSRSISASRPGIGKPAYVTDGQTKV